MSQAFPDLEAFLGCPTPDAWLHAARDNLDVLLIDHAHCEKKAASTALNLMFRYTGHDRLQHWLSRLAREELRHYEQVLAILRKRGIEYRPLTPSRYAAGLREGIRTHEPARMVDTLLSGAFIEARSCERFRRLAPCLQSGEPELARYYERLQASEARHFEQYLELATEAAEAEEIGTRIEWFRSREAELVQSADPQFRFHSGVPAVAEADLSASAGGSDSRLRDVL